MGISLNRLATSAIGMRTRAGQTVLLIFFGRTQVDECQLFAGVHQLLHPFGGELIDGVFHAVAGEYSHGDERHRVANNVDTSL